MTNENKTTMAILIYFNRLFASLPDIFLWSSDSLYFDHFWLPRYTKLDFGERTIVHLRHYLCECYIHPVSMTISRFFYLNTMLWTYTKERHKGYNTGKKAIWNNFRDPRERFVVSNQASNSNLSRGCLRFFRLALICVFDYFSH